MTDLIEIPTNGRQPPQETPEPERIESRERPVTFSPPQLAVGAAVIAALLVVGFRWLRRRRR
jgi:hypothetical protein